MPDRIRMLVVGVGRGRDHLQSLVDLPEQFGVAGVVARSVDRAAKALEELNLPTDLAYASYDEALANAECDGVMIATWARTHAELVEQALRARKHVLVEKPFTVRLDAAERLLDIADAGDLKIVVTQQFRYMPGQRMVRRLLSEGAYGEPQTGHVLTYKARHGEYADSPYSQLWQMTVHEVDSVTAMMNQPVVEVYGHPYRPPATTWKRESTVTAELRFENGCRMVMVSTSDARAASFEFRVECAEGAVVYRNIGGFGRVEELRIAQDRESGLQLSPIDVGQSQSSLDQQVAAGFAAWVRGGAEPETSGRNNLQVLRVLDGIIRSAETSRPVKLAV